MADPDPMDDLASEVRRFFDRFAVDDLRRMDGVLRRLAFEPDLIDRIMARRGARTSEEREVLRAYEPYSDWCRLLASLRRCATKHDVPVGNPPHVPQDIGAIARQAGVEWTDEERDCFTGYLIHDPSNLRRILTWILRRLRVHVEWNGGDPHEIVAANAEDALGKFCDPSRNSATSLDGTIDWYLPKQAPAPTRAFVQRLNDRFEALHADVLAGQIMGGYLWGLLLARIQGEVYPKVDSHCLAEARRWVRTWRGQDFPMLLPLQDDQLAAEACDGGSDPTLPPDAGPRDRTRQAAALQRLKDAIRNRHSRYADALDCLPEEQQVVFLSRFLEIPHSDIAGTVTTMPRIDWEHAGRRGKQPPGCTENNSRQLAWRAQVGVVERVGRRALAPRGGSDIQVDIDQPLAAINRACEAWITWMRDDEPLVTTPEACKWPDSLRSGLADACLEEARFILLGRLMLDKSHRDIAEKISKERVGRLLGALPADMRKLTECGVSTLIRARRGEVPEAARRLERELRAAHAARYPGETEWLTSNCDALRGLRFTEYESRTKCHRGLMAILQLGWRQGDEP